MKEYNYEDIKKEIEDLKKDRNKTSQEILSEVEPDCAEMCEKLWQMYPRKQGKQAAMRILPRHIKRYGYKQVERALLRYLAEKQNTDKQYILLGGRFFSSRIIDYLDDNYEGEENNNTSVSTKDIEANNIVAKIEGYEDYLQTMMNMPYEDYLKTEHWLHFRAEAIKFFGNRCMLCNNDDSKIHIHHKTYKNRGRETFNDVIVLCDKCHGLFHKNK